MSIVAKTKNRLSSLKTRIDQIGRINFALRTLVLLALLTPMAYIVGVPETALLLVLVFITGTRPEKEQLLIDILWLGFMFLLFEIQSSLNVSAFIPVAWLSLELFILFWSYVLSWLSSYILVRMFYHFDAKVTQ